MLQTQQQEYKFIGTSRTLPLAEIVLQILTYWGFSINCLEFLKVVGMDGIQHDAPHAMGNQQPDVINTDINMYMNAGSPIAHSNNQTKKESWDSSEEVMFIVQTWLPARDLVRMELVCKQWRNWQRLILTDENYFPRGLRPSNSVLEDWYFPTTLSTAIRIRPPTLRWFGVHLSTGFQFHKLPDLSFLPAPPEVYRTVSSAGGLVWLQQEDSNAFIVCNPLTKKWKQLPPCESTNLWHLKHMVMDENSKSYKAYIISGDYVREYRSACERWSAMERFERPRITRYVYSSVVLEGYVYSLEEDGYRHTIVEVFDTHDKLWRSDMIYTLFDQHMHHQIFKGHETFAPNLVVCLGAIYVVVPVEEFEHDAMPRPFYYTAVRFHIFKLQQQTGSFEFQSKLPAEPQVIAPARRDWAGSAHNWYSCNSNQNVIWLACSSHLIQYDVISESWKNVVREHSCKVGSLPF